MSDDYQPNPTQTAEPDPTGDEVARVAAFLEQPSAASRSADGRFAARQAAEQPAAADPAKDAKVANIAKDAKPAEAAPPADDDEQWLELPPVDGKGEPIRHKLSDVFAGFQEAENLKKQLAESKRPQTLPADIEHALSETIQERQRYIEALSYVGKLNEVQAPDEELINPDSAKYNPELYFRQMTAAKTARERAGKVAEELDRARRLDAEQRMTVARSHHAREAAKLHEAWPEIRDKATQSKVLEAIKAYGIDEDTLTKTDDHRFYLVLRDAMAFRDLKAKEKTAAKVVTAKPRIVAGSARNPAESGQDAARRAALQRLQKSGSDDATVDFFRTLLN